MREDPKSATASADSTHPSATPPVTDHDVCEIRLVVYVPQPVAQQDEDGGEAGREPASDGPRHRGEGGEPHRAPRG